LVAVSDRAATTLDGAAARDGVGFGVGLLLR
jgi:hypothetical protein